MRNKIKTLAAVAALGVATIGIYSGAGVAGTSENSVPMKTISTTANNNAHSHRMLRLTRCRHFFHHHHGVWNLGLHRDKHLTAVDAKTITKAALLMRGRHNLEVGKIDTKVSKRGHKWYVINIINKENKTVSRVALNSQTGRIHPLRSRG